MKVTRGWAAVTSVFNLCLTCPLLLLPRFHLKTKRKNHDTPGQHFAISLEAAKLGSQVCLAVSSFIGVGVVAQLLIKEGITSQDDPSTSSKEKGKVLRVLPSGRWQVPEYLPRSFSFSSRRIGQLLSNAWRLLPVFSRFREEGKVRGSSVWTWCRGDIGPRVNCFLSSLSFSKRKREKQRLTFPFPFVHHQPHDWKVEQLLTVERRTLKRRSTVGCSSLSMSSCGWSQRLCLSSYF